MAVIVVQNEKPIKACNCKEPIVASMSGTAHAVSKMNG